MLTGIETRECLKCGNEFQFLRGGIVFQIFNQMFPKCPNCGSRKTKIKAGINVG